MNFLSRLNPQVLKDWILSLTIRPTVSPHYSIRSSSVVIGCAVIVLTGAFGSRFYNEPRLVEGVISPEELTAPRSTSIKDEEKTEELRDLELQKVRVYYKVDKRLTEDILASLSERLIEAATLRRIAGAFPYNDTELLSLPLQRELRSLSTPQLQTLFAQVKPDSTRPNDSPISQQVWQSLQGIQGDTSTWTQFTKAALAAQRRYQTALNSSSILLTEEVKRDVLNISDSDWRNVIPTFRDTGRQILTQGIPGGLSDEILANTVSTHLTRFDGTVQTLGKSLFLPLLKPNLKSDPAVTAREQKKILDRIDVVKIEVTEGQVIVEKGQVITREQFLVLEYFNLSRRSINWQGLGVMAVGVMAAIAAFHIIHTQKTQIPLSRRDYLLLLILTITAPIIVAVSFLEYTSLPAIGLLVGSLYGSVIGGTTVALITLVTALGLDTGFAQLFAIGVGSFVGSLLARQPRSREELALLGLIIAILQGFLYFLFLSVSGGFGYGILTTAGRQGILGLIWSIATLGISPYIEKLFDLVTPIRLAELANPNRPLLKRLAMETPGTFQHTLFVATLAEAGARSLNCNVELVRTGTLYHDIGKMHYPMAFIENQFGRENVHEQLQDPWASAEIIKKHVTEGLVMAKKYHLPSSVAAFIPEHQGTILIAYFHHQAQQKTAQSDESTDVLESDFRYAGPIPQTRETAIVMLADACEAALRSLKECNTELAFNTINKIFKARWKDGQLSESSLTRDDLKVLAQVFVDVWQQFHHQRITYPSQLSTGS